MSTPPSPPAPPANTVTVSGIVIDVPQTVQLSTTRGAPGQVAPGRYFAKAFVDPLNPLVYGLWPIAKGVQCLQNDKVAHVFLTVSHTGHVVMT